MWEITDNNSTIYSGTESEMLAYWKTITENGNPDNIEWDGDLKLIQIHNIFR